jgi:hypothetical protein
MSAISKYFSLLMLGGFAFYAVSAHAITTTKTDELYPESLKLERSSAEIPSSIDIGEEYVADPIETSVNPSEELNAAEKNTTPAKKITSKSIKTKKSSRN